MNYAIVRCTNGAFNVESEWENNKDGAIVAFHNYCAALWNATEAVDAWVKILDSNLDEVDGYGEHIVHGAK